MMKILMVGEDDLISYQYFIQIWLAFQQQQGNAGEQSAFQNIYNFFATLLKRNYIFFTNISEQKISQFLATADGNIRESIQIMPSEMEVAPHPQNNWYHTKQDFLGTLERLKRYKKGG